MQVSLRTALLAFAALGLPTIAAGVHKDATGQALSMGERASQIWAAARPLLQKCHEVRPARSALADAIIAIEIDRRSSWEPAAEHLALRVAAMIGVRPPDFSFGPAQVRPSVLQRDGLAPGGVETAARLSTDPCYSIAMADQIVAEKWRSCRRREGPRICFVAVARDYNGQSTYAPHNIAYLKVLRALYLEATALSSLSSADLERI
jgi:hypothetical protein